MKTLILLVFALSVFTSTDLAQSSDQRLKERLDSSWAIIEGRVTDVTKVTGVQSRISEHSPNWYFAEVKVKSVLKGMVLTTVPDKILKVYFPASQDVAWYDSPKFRKGQKGIWLLRFTMDTELKKYDVNAKTSLDPLDFQPTSQLKRIRILLGK